MTNELQLQRQLGLSLLAISVVATLSLFAVPSEIIKPASLDMSPIAFRALTMINPLVLVTAAVALGSWLAPKVQLDAPLIRATILGRGAGVVLRRQIVPALIVGTVGSGVLYGYSIISTPWFAAAKIPDVPIPLITKVLYGGIVEELMTRWGGMTLFVWAGWRLLRRPVSAPAALYIIGALIAALVFAAGHLPVLFSFMPNPPIALVAAVIIGNTIPGLLFGLLFWRRGLESAMIAHAIGHLLFTLMMAS